MSTNALRLPEGHVALALLIPPARVDEIVEAAHGFAAAWVTHDPDVIFWADDDDAAEGRDFGLPHRGDPEPAEEQLAAFAAHERLGERLAASPEGRHAAEVAEATEDLDAAGLAFIAARTEAAYAAARLVVGLADTAVTAEPGWEDVATLRAATTGITALLTGLGIGPLCHEHGTSPDLDGCSSEGEPSVTVLCGDCHDQLAVL